MQPVFGTFFILNVIQNMLNFCAGVKMIFDLVIPTFNRFEKLLRCLKSIPKQPNVNVFVYFDNNDFETYNKVKELNENYTLIVMDKKYQAFGIWNHHLANNFSGDVFIYLCDDTEIYPDTLNNVERHFEEKFPDT